MGAVRLARRLIRRMLQRARGRVRVFRILRHKDGMPRGLYTPRLDSCQVCLLAAIILLAFLLISVLQGGRLFSALAEFWRTGIEMGLRIYQPKGTERRPQEVSGKAPEGYHVDPFSE